MKQFASDPLLSQAYYTPALEEAVLDPNSRWATIYSNLIQDPDILAEFQIFLQVCPEKEDFRPKDSELIKHTQNVIRIVGLDLGSEKAQELKIQCETNPFGYYIWFVYKCALKAWQSSWPETDFKQLSYVILQVLVRNR